MFLSVHTHHMYLFVTIFFNPSIRAGSRACILQTLVSRLTHDSLVEHQESMSLSTVLLSEKGVTPMSNYIYIKKKSLIILFNIC